MQIQIGLINPREIRIKKETLHWSLLKKSGDEGSRTPVQNGSKQASTNIVFISLVKTKEKTNLYNFNKVFLSDTHLDSYLDMSTIINILRLAWWLLRNRQAGLLRRLNCGT